MSAARDLFLQVNWLTAHGDKAAVEKLSEAAKLWRLDGQYFSAGIAMSRASDAAWGRPDEMLTAHLAAVKDFEQAIETNPPDSPTALARSFYFEKAQVIAPALNISGGGGMLLATAWSGRH
jgi:hypothetical protein